MLISVVNHTSGKIKDEELQHVIRALNRQINEDFEPYWSLGGTLRLEDCRKSANKDGAFSDRTGGQAVSRRIYKVFTGREESSTDI